MLETNLEGTRFVLPCSTFVFLFTQDLFYPTILVFVPETNLESVRFVLSCNAYVYAWNK